MKHFSTVPLGSIAKFINGDRGKNYPSKSSFVDSGVPFINAGHLVDGNIDFTAMNFISEERYEKLGSGKTQPEDILYCLRGSLGKTAIVRHEGSAAIASSLVIIRPSKECCTDYLYRYLTSPYGESEIKRFDNGSSQPNLSAKSVKQYPIPLPPIAEQKRIAAILDAADALRVKRREAIAQLDALLQSTFLEMFGDPVANPRTQRIETLSECLETDIDYRGKTPKKSSSGVPLLSAANVKNGRIDLSYEQYISHEDYKNWTTRGFTQAGDVLITTEAPVGEVALYPEEGVFQISRRVIALRTNAKILPEILLHIMLCKSWHRRLLRKTRGSTVPRVLKPTIMEQKIPIFPIELQYKFKTILESIENQKRQQQSCLAELDTLFASLQSRAFNGEL